jgi:hypothetical protein
VADRLPMTASQLPGLVHIIFVGNNSRRHHTTGEALLRPHLHIFAVSIRL